MKPSSIIINNVRLILVATVPIVLFKYIGALHLTRGYEPLGPIILSILSILALVAFLLNKNMSMGLLTLEAEEKYKYPRIIFMFVCIFILVESIDSLIFNYV